MQMRRTFGALTLSEAMRAVPVERFTSWSPQVEERELSATIADYLLRLQAFDLENSEAAKILLIDALFAEVVPSYPSLKVWKAATLESDTLSGVADYLIAPNIAYVTSPLLCAVEAKKDDFVKGAVQCIAEMIACRWNNRQSKMDFDVYGIVSNGNVWQFYCLTPTDILYETTQYSLHHLNELLGVLHHVCAACAANISQKS